MTDLLFATKLIRHLKVRLATVSARHRRGWIPCLRAGRHPVKFDVSAVEEALQKRVARTRGDQ